MCSNTYASPPVKSREQIKELLQTAPAVRVEEEPPETWALIFRQGITPQLSTQALEALRDGLANDDPRLVQGMTSVPPPLQAVQDMPVEAACAVAFAGWKGEGLKTVGELGHWFDDVMVGCAKLIGDPDGVRWFLNWFDDTPRAQMIRGLLAEVERELASRQGRVVRDGRCTACGAPAREGRVP
jgi:hypothetical protein